MLRTILLLLLTLPAAAEPVDRKTLKPGLVATIDGVSRLEPTVAGSDFKTATFTGYIQIVTPGDYTFTPPVSLTKDGKAVSGKLDSGYYEFKAEAVGPRIEQLWQGPGFSREPIPWFFFGHLPSQRPDHFASDARRESGRFLFEELACAKCHSGVKDLAERSGPNLTKIGSRAFAGWLDAWLADPSKLRPHTTMPKLFGTDDRGVAERYAVVQYLTSLGGPLLEVKLPFSEKANAKSLKDGATLFTSAGCAACHGPKLAGTMKRNDDDDEPPPFQPLDSVYGLGSTPQARYALGGLGSKTTADELAKYLKDPLSTNPHGRMPAMNLTSDEARDLARHLIRTTDDSIPNKIGVAAPKGITKTAAEWRTQGKELFQSKGCANCHTVDGNKSDTPAFAKFDVLAKGVQNGCLADAPKTVIYNLDDRQRTALREFVTSPGTPSPQYATRSALKRFNCLNCHKKDSEGGLGSELAEIMKKLETAGNEDDVQPPRLTGIGHKATTAWLNDVLLKGSRARPWMNLRMPQYGDANVGHLPVGLAACEGLLPDGAASKSKPPLQAIEAGRKLAGKEGLGCVACHDISGYVGGGTRGPDLATTDRRVRQEWYTRWMHNPQRLAPGTKMPQNFTDGVSVSKLLNSDANAQIEALWSYFSLGPGLPLPAGLEPPGKVMALLVKDRPEILRTFMPDGSGTRPIAVGYPGGGSFVFDSHANRIVYAWEGNFLDVKPVWDARGGNSAKLLGTKFLTLPSGPAFGVSNEQPDFVKQADDYAYGAPVPFQNIYSGPMRTHFEGYVLDTQGRPTFSYRVDDAKSDGSASIRETPLPVKASIMSGLQRSFAVDATKLKGQSLWLQVANSTQPPRFIDAKGVTSKVGAPSSFAANGGTLILPQAEDKALVVKLGTVPPGTEWHFASKDGKSTRAMLKLPAGQYEVAHTVWSLPQDDESMLRAIDGK